MKKICVYLLAAILLLSGCNFTSEEAEGTFIDLYDELIKVDGEAITNDTSLAVYEANDIIFYQAGQDFTYGEGTEEDAHEKLQADAHKVIHITKPGKYILSGKLSLGQVAVDLGENAESDPEACVTLVLNGVDITCEVAPAIIFYNVYECGSKNEEEATKDVNTKDAGANVIIADGSVNNVNGSYVAKIYKSYELSEDGTEVVDSKKLHKYDGAFYSKMSVNIDGGKKGDGILNINAENEGLGSELHLTINGGVINIISGNDGINTNEDNISVTAINGGTLNIRCNGSTGEGDGIDSNGWLVINGGSVKAEACAFSGDAGIDSDRGIYINGGKVAATGNMLDHIAGGSQTYAVFNFLERQNGGSKYSLINSENKTVGEYLSQNAFTHLIIAGDELTEGQYTFLCDGKELAGSKISDMNAGAFGGMPPMQGGKMPEGEFNEEGRPEMPEGEFGAEGRPEMPEGEFGAEERPEMPEGGYHGGADHQNLNGNMMQRNEFSKFFAIIKGGNQFMVTDT